ncbi:MAG: hypothetical protein LC730_00030 [Acidobacteria bacterium]|nr:hypothetical protein [Acidobacteriota bacterium]MCA1607837.1 hypothetical protein [Acidobacteriota bacterium]
MAEENGSGGPGAFIWALALIAIVAIIVAVLFSGGFLGSGNKEIDVEIKAPTTTR